MNDESDLPNEPEAIDIAKIIPDALSPEDAVKLDDEIGIPAAQAIGGLAGDDRES